jgi:hypothetical protein
MNFMGVMASFSIRQGFKDVVGEFGKPNPPAPFPRREGGAGKPLSLLGEGLGRGQTPQLIDQHYH